jgi:hypothetical protein
MKRPPSSKPYATRPKFATGDRRLFKSVEGWDYVHDRTVDHYIRIIFPDGTGVTFVTRVPRA